MDIIENDFKDNLINFIDELILQFPEEVDLILARILLKNKEDSVIKTLNDFVKHILPHKEKIYERDEKSLLFIFSGMNESVESEYIQKILSLWNSNKLDADDKKVMWDYFDLFTKLAEKYQALM